MRSSILLVVSGLAFATATATAVTAAIAAPVVSHGSLGGCAPKVTKIKGHTAVVNCGPATATLRVSGKTYKFKNGTCRAQPNGLPLVQLGTSVVGAAKNAGYTDFQLVAVSKNDTTVSADSGSFHLSALQGKSSGSGMIAFSGHTGDNSVSFTGSVNCHGVIEKT